MANYVNNSGQTRLGWRVTTQPVVTPYLTTLLDLYSGAAAAYSLRKLKSSYTGSAIRVRRSSDNTEQDIGFDSNGNLDTIALSSFVGSGSGFVKTWYDQTGNNFNRTQTTAAAQPNIVYLGAINMVNGKPAMYFDGTGTTFALQGPKIGETYQGAGYSSTVLNVIKLDSSYSTTEEYPLFGGTGWYDSRFSINSNKWYLINTGTGISSTVNASANQVVSSVVFAYTTDKVRINGTEVISGNVGISGGTDYNFIGQSWLGKRYKGYFQEHIIYASDKTSVISAMESNMNTYYSVYPNPTSVWNLLNAVYSADTIASSSLKTSLVASYNGESNANDSFGTNNGTAVGGLTYSTGKIGNAFVFNGSNSYVKLTTDTMKFAGDFSISAWCYFSGASANTQTIFSNLTGYGAYGYGYYLYYMNNTLTFQINNSLPFASGGNVQLNYGVNIFNGWHLVTVTRKYSTGTKMYLNGNLVANNTSTYNPNYHSNMIPCIGSTDYGTTYNGLVQYYSNSGTKIDALNIWTKELTASEVSELYNSGNGAQYIGDNFYKPTTNDALLVNNGTAVGGLTYGLGKVGTAFVGNGTNAYVSLPNTSGQFNFAGDFSVSMWFRSSNLSASRYAVGNYKAGGSYGYGWVLYYTGSGGFAFDVRNNNSINQVSKLLPLLTNTWYHVVAVRKMGQIHKLYVNGVDQLAPQTDGNVNIIAAYTTNQPMNICGISDIFPALCDLDGVNMWNRTLTQSEVTELYNSGNGKQYPN